MRRKAIVEVLEFDGPIISQKWAKETDNNEYMFDQHSYTSNSSSCKTYKGDSPVQYMGLIDL